MLSAYLPSGTSQPARYFCRRRRSALLTAPSPFVSAAAQTISTFQPARCFCRRKRSSLLTASSHDIVEGITFRRECRQRKRHKQGCEDTDASQKSVFHCSLPLGRLWKSRPKFEILYKSIVSPSAIYVNKKKKSVRIFARIFYQFTVSTVPMKMGALPFSQSMSR